MPRDASAIASILAAFSPEKRNPDADPSIGAHVFTPSMALDAINNSEAMGDDEPFKSVDEARQAGYKISDTPVYHDKDGNDITDKINQWSPMQKRGVWGRILNPSAAAEEDRINNQYQISQSLAARSNRVKNAIAGGNFQQVLDNQNTPVNQLDGETAALSTEYMPSIEGAEQKRNDLQKGVPASNTIASLASNTATTERATNQALKDRKSREAGNIDLSVDSENKDLKSNILGSQRLINNAPAYDTLAKLTLGNQIAQQSDVVPKRTQLESGELDASLANLPEQNKLTRINLINQLNDAHQKGEIAPDVYAAQKSKVKSDAAMSAQELKDIQHYVNTAHFKAQLGSVTAKADYARFPAQKTIADVGAKLGAATMEQQYSDLPLELTKMHKQAQIGALTSAKDFGSIIADRTLGSKYGLDKDKVLAGQDDGVITLSSGKTIKVNKGSGGGTITKKPIATPITNDVSPSAEFKGTQDDAVLEDLQQGLQRLKAKNIPSSNPAADNSKSEALQEAIYDEAAGALGYQDDPLLKRSTIFKLKGGFDGDAQSRLDKLSPAQQISLYSKILARMKKN
jgi:hypothetical protein